MKKLLTAILTLSIIMTLSGTAWATAETNVINENSSPAAADTTVSFTVDPTYTVTIPAAVTAQYQEADNCYVGQITLTADDVLLREYNVLTIAVSSTRFNVMESVNRFYFESTSPRTELLYDITTSQTFEGSDAITNNSVCAVFQTLDPWTSTQSAQLTLTSDEVKYAGEYDTTLTFTVAVDAPEFQ